MPAGFPAISGRLFGLRLSFSRIFFLLESTMVAYNVTIDDTSPVIEYSGTWVEKHDDGKQFSGDLRYRMRETKTTAETEPVSVRSKNKGLFHENF